MSIRVPRLLAGLVADAALLPSCGGSPRRALQAHLAHRRAWYAALVGPLLLPASTLVEAVSLAEPAADGERLDVGVLADSGPAPAGLRAVGAAIDAVRDHFVLRRVEAPVAMRNQDPRPGLQAMIALAAQLPAMNLDDECLFYAEIPLTWGLLASLDDIEEARAAGASIAPKFRTGGLAAELFPTPMELGAVICACRDRHLPFVVAAGAHRAIRRTDPETGLVTHGFLNLLAAVLAAADGAEPVDLAEILGGTDPHPVVARVEPRLAEARPLWQGFATPNLLDHVSDLRSLNLLAERPNAAPSP